MADDPKSKLQTEFDKEASKEFSSDKKIPAAIKPDDFASEFDAEFEPEKEVEEVAKTAAEQQAIDYLAKDELERQKYLKMTELTLGQKIQKKLAIVKKVVDIIKGIASKIFGLQFKLLGITIKIMVIVKYIVLLIVVFIGYQYVLNYKSYVEDVYDYSFMERAENEYKDSFDKDIKTLSEKAEEIALIVDNDGNEEIGPAFELKNILMNVYDTVNSKNKLMKISIGFELESEEPLDELKQRQNQIKHMIIVELSNTAYVEFKEIRNRRDIKLKIKKMLNGFLKTGSVRKVFFTEVILN